MFRRKEQSIGEVLNFFLHQNGLESPLNEFHLMNSAWRDVLGNAIMRYTGDMFIKNQTLHVEIKSPALKHDLFLRRDRLVQQLNEKVGAQVITSIMFH